MEDIIAQINKSIESKCSSLKKKANDDFELISDLTSTRVRSGAQKAKGGSSLNIPKILYKSSGVLLSGSIVTKLVDCTRKDNTYCQSNELTKYDSDSISEDSLGSILSKVSGGMFLASLCSAAVGYILSKVISHDSSKTPSHESLNIENIKNEVISKGIASVKYITNDWDDFMEKNQKELFKDIDSSSLSENEKDNLTSKIFSFEVVDINLSDLMSLINSAATLTDIVKGINDFKSMFIASIENTVNKQIAKYNSLII